MNAATVTFLIIGGVGLLLLIVSLVLDDVLQFGDGTAADGPFSLPSVSAAVGGFGFGGALVASLSGASGVLLVGAGVAGVAVAVPAAYGASALARAASRMRTDGTPARSDMVGCIGVVVTPIPTQGYGEVRISLGGQPVKLNAMSDRPVPLGAEVFVIEAPTDTSVVVEQTVLI